MPRTSRKRKLRKALSRAIKKRRSMKSRLPRRRIPLALKPHSFVERKVTDLVMSCDTEGSATGMFKSFTLDDCNNASQYKSLFEYYRIDKVVVTFRYKCHSAANLNTTVGQRPNEINPLLYFKVDHNDINADSLLLMRQSMKTKEKMLTNNQPEFTIQLKPAIQTEGYKSALASTYMPKWGQWISTDDSSVPHYGLKAYAIAFRDANTNPADIQVSFKYYVSFKNNE